MMWWCYLHSHSIITCHNCNHDKCVKFCKDYIKISKRYRNDKMSSTLAINGQEVNCRIDVLPQLVCAIQFWGNSPGKKWWILTWWAARTAAIGSGLVLPSSGRWTSSASKPWWRPPRKRLSWRVELKGETIRWLSGGREMKDWVDAGLSNSEGKNLR